MFEFRILSQDWMEKQTDYPYSAGLILEPSTSSKGKFSLSMPHNGGVMPMAYYDTREEAEKVMKAVTEAYKDFIFWAIDRDRNAGSVMPDPFFKLP